MTDEKLKMLIEVFPTGTYAGHRLSKRQAEVINEMIEAQKRVEVLLTSFAT